MTTSEPPRTPNKLLTQPLSVITTRTRPIQLQRTHRRQQSSLSSFDTPPASATSTQFFFSPPQTPSKQITKSSSTATTPSSVHSQQTSLYNEQGRYHGPVAVPAESFPSLKKHFTTSCIDGPGSPSRYRYSYKEEDEKEDDKNDTKLVFTDEDEVDDYFEYPPRTPVRFQKSPIDQQADSPVQTTGTPTLKDNKSTANHLNNRRSVLVNSSLSQDPQIIKTEADNKRYSVYLTMDDYEDLSNQKPSSDSLSYNEMKSFSNKLPYGQMDYFRGSQSFDTNEPGFTQPIKFKNLNERFMYEEKRKPKKKNSISNIWRRVTSGFVDNGNGRGVIKETTPAVRSKIFHKRNKSSAI